MIPIILANQKAFSPGNLPGIAPSIQVALMRQRGLLWQDLAKTTPANANNDPVAVATCPFTGVDFINGAGLARPVLTNISGNYWGYTLDGVNSRIGATTTLTIPNTTTIGFNQSAPFSSQYIFDGGALNQRALLSDSATSLRIYNGVGLSLTVPNMTGVWRNTTTVFNGASSSITQGGSSITGNAGSTAASTSAFNLCGNTSGRPAGILTCAINVNALVSAANQALLTAYVNNTHP